MMCALFHDGSGGSAVRQHAATPSKLRIASLAPPSELTGRFADRRQAGFALRVPLRSTKVGLRSTYRPPATPPAISKDQ